MSFSNGKPNGQSLADEWFADFMHRVQAEAPHRTKALREAYPRPQDAKLAELREYDHETEMMRRFIAGQSAERRAS